MPTPAAGSDRPPLIVTDSTCDLPPAIYEQYAIKVVPLKIHFGQETYTSGVDMTLEQFFARLAQSDTPPTTSSPSAEEIKALYEQSNPEHRPILSIHLSEALSKTASTAREAARRLPDHNITVWNSRMVSGSLGLQVLTAARAAQAGCTIEQIIPLLEHTYAAGNMLFCMEDLSYLYQGGRIGRVSYYVAQTLRLKPIVTVSKAGDTLGTYIAASERPHSLKDAVNSFVREIAKTVSPRGKVRVVTLYGDSISATLAEELNQKLTERFDCVYLATTPSTPVLAAHVGPRALGVAYAAGDWAV